MSVFTVTATVMGTEADRCGLSICDSVTEYCDTVTKECGSCSYLCGISNKEYTQLCKSKCKGKYNIHTIFIIRQVAIHS